MVVEVFMPRLTHDMTSGRLIHWNKKEGDEIHIGDVLFEVETDKAISEVQAEANGKLRNIAYWEDQEVPVGALMAFIVPEGEGIPDLPLESSQQPFSRPSNAIDIQATNKKRVDIQQHTIPESRLLITPIARRLAKEYHIDVNQVKGSGPRGRIVEADIASWIEQHQGYTKTETEDISELSYDVIQQTEIQRLTGLKMAQSASSIPQFMLEVDVNVNELSGLREFISTQLGIKISYTTLFIEATAKALKHHPGLNTSFIDGDVRFYRSINIGVATATAQGLLAPVIHRADTLTLEQIQVRINYFQNRAEGKAFSVNDLSNGTFTISNLGMYGIDRFTALINPPQVAILAIGRIHNKVVMINELPSSCPFVTLRLSVDHRILDGATASPFLMEIKNRIENPRFSQGI